MFGYVNAYKDLLRVCDYNVFRGYYCGLCKQLGKNFNQLTRFGLSYDMTFLAILTSSLSGDKPDLKYENCIAHPMTKRPVIHDDDGISYSADISVILTYLKLKDDWDDEKNIKSLARIFYMRSYKKVSANYRDKFEIISENMRRLHQLESEKCGNPDMPADCFGKIIETVFDRYGDNKALAWLGYHIGRFIYITDAFNDINDDYKNKNYNPFIVMMGENTDKDEIREDVINSLTYTLSEIANAYNLLDIKKNKEILDNIIYLGLRQNLDKM